VAQLTAIRQGYQEVDGIENVLRRYMAMLKHMKICASMAMLAVMMSIPHE
jgi:translation initiation factor 2 beta subunit (eIF-2beta)/eIF-5